MPTYKPLRAYRARLRKRIETTWARAWPMRSRFTNETLKRRANNYLEAHQENILFITGSGRSGTQLISGLLDKSAESTVFHEPNFTEDVATMDQLRWDQDLASRFWLEFRGVRVFQRWKSAPKARVYGEVSGTIRYHAPALSRLYPRAHMLLLARDGRGVIRTLMQHPVFYRPGARGAYALSPLPGDPYYDEWPHMTRFERLCWMWRDSNEFPMQVIPRDRWLQLERLLSDFDYFSENLACIPGINITHELWLRYKAQKSRNSTTTHTFPAWDQWSHDHKDSFERICGPTMSRLGYEL